MQRRILGVAAILTLLGAVVTWLWQPEANNWPTLAFYWQNALAFCWRMGAVLAAAWLAFDDVQRIPGWLLVISPVLLIVLVRSPKFFLLLLPVLVVCAILRRFLMPPGDRQRR